MMPAISCSFLSGARTSRNGVGLPTSWSFVAAVRRGECPLARFLDLHQQPAVAFLRRLIFGQSRRAEIDLKRQFEPARFVGDPDRAPFGGHGGDDAIEETFVKFRRLRFRRGRALRSRAR